MNNYKLIQGLNSFPKLSVIIPVFNVEGYLVECLDSIVAQNYPNIEIIAIDDGSTDGSLSVLTEYAKQCPQLQVINQKNSGAGVARNKGVEIAKGKYVLFVDPDDVIELGALDELVGLAEEKSAEIVLFSIARYDSELKTEILKSSQPRRAVALPDVFSGKDIASNIYTIFSDGPSPCNKLILREFIVSNNLKFQALPRVNDLCFSYSALALAQRITIINKAYYKYRTNRKGSSQNTTDRDPTPVCFAYLRLKEVLLQKGVFDKFSVSFYKAFYNSCAYTFRQMKSLITAKDLHNKLHSDKFSLITGAKLDRTAFESSNEYLAYTAFWQEEQPYMLMLSPKQRNLAVNMPNFLNDKKRRVLGIMCSSLRPGGIERAITHLVPIFEKNGYNIVLMTSAPESPIEYPLPEGCVRVVTGRDTPDGSRYDCIKAVILKYEIKTVIAHEYYFLTVGKDIDAVHSAGAKVVVHHHSVFSNMYLREGRERTLPQILKAYKKADAMITLSDIDAAFFNLVGCKAIKIVDPVPKILPLSEKKSSGHTIIWVARFVEGKRPLDAIKIFELVYNQMPDARLIMLGDGEIGQVKSVKAYLDSNPQLRDVVSLKGHQENVFEYEKDADLFLTTTQFDGFSLSIVEAKAMGLPVVSYSMPYLETVKPGTGVVSVPQGDIVAAAEAIRRIFNDRDLSQRLSIESRASYDYFASFDQWKSYSYLFSLLDGSISFSPRHIDYDSLEIIIDTMLTHVDQALNRVLSKNIALDKDLGNVQNKLESERENAAVLSKSLTERNQLITAKDKRIDDLERRVKLRTKEVVERNQLITAKDKRIDDLERRVKLRTKEVVERNQLITAKDKRIEGYIRDIENLKNSRSYRLGLLLTWPIRKILRMR